MIPDFVLSVDVGSRLGAQALVCRDVPLAVFFHGYPVEAAQAPGFLVARTRWVDALLSRAVIAPALTPEDVHEALGPARPLVERRYLAAVGIGPPAAPDGFWRGGTVGVPVSWHPALLAPPDAGMRGAVQALAEAYRLPPHVVWLGWTISEYLLATAMLPGARAAMPPEVDRYGIGMEGQDD